MYPIVKKNLFKIDQGFTLIEIIIYLGLFSIVVGGFLLITYGLVQGSGQSQSKAILNEEMNFLMQKINWALTGASNVDVTGTTLVITNSNLPTNPTIFDLSVDKLIMNGAPLNSDSVSVTNLAFNEILASGTAGLETTITLKNFYEIQTNTSIKYPRF